MASARRINSTFNHAAISKVDEQTNRKSGAVGEVFNWMTRPCQKLWKKHPYVAMALPLVAILGLTGTGFWIANGYNASKAAGSIYSWGKSGVDLFYDVKKTALRYFGFWFMVDCAVNPEPLNLEHLQLAVLSAGVVGTTWFVPNVVYAK